MCINSVDCVVGNRISGSEYMLSVLVLELYDSCSPINIGVDA